MKKIFNLPPILRLFISILQMPTFGNPILGPWKTNPASIFGSSTSRLGPPILGPFISIPLLF